MLTCYASKNGDLDCLPIWWSSEWINILKCRTARRSVPCAALRWPSHLLLWVTPTPTLFGAHMGAKLEKRWFHLIFTIELVKCSNKSTNLGSWQLICNWASCVSYLFLIILYNHIIYKVWIQDIGECLESKKKRRFKADGYMLDEVWRILEDKQQDHFKVYNLFSERFSG
jgi:hypothetical protein